MSPEAKPHRVLIVEDHEEIVDRWLRTVKSLPHVVVDVARGAEGAIASVEAQDYDLLLLDIIMYPREAWPVEDSAGGFLSGIELYKEIARMCHAQRRRMPAVLVTSGIEATRPDLANGARLFFTECDATWLSKPVSLRELRSRVAEILGIEEEVSRKGQGNGGIV